VTQTAAALSLSLLLAHAAPAAPLAKIDEARLQIFEQERVKAFTELRALDDAPRSDEKTAQQHRLREDLAALERETTRVRALPSSTLSHPMQGEASTRPTRVAVRDAPNRSVGNYQPWDVLRNFPRKEVR
jgi:hypothetical protein